MFEIFRYKRQNNKIMFTYFHVKKNIKMQDSHIQIKGGIPDLLISIYWFLKHMPQAFMSCH